jgi:hypothetical protein
MKKHFTRRIIGAIAGALAVSALFTLFGYSDYEGPTGSIYIKELCLALASYVPAAFLVNLLLRNWDSRFADAGCVALVGTAISWIMKLVFLDGENGIPAYLASAAREHSWRPYGDLLKNGVNFILFATVLSFTFIALGVFLGNLFPKRRSRSAP